MILNKVLSKLKIKVSSHSNMLFCDACQYGKLHQFSFPSAHTHTTQAFQLVYLDVCASQLSCEGYQYHISFMDDFTRYLWIFPLQKKSDAVTMFLQFHKMVATQYCTSIKCLQTDWGGEYRKFQSLLHDLGIGFRHPCPHTHQQNGKIERKHQSSRNKPYLACKSINGYQILVGGLCFSCLPS